MNTSALIIRSFVAAASLLVTLGGCLPARAQPMPGSPPSEHDCKVAANKAASNPHSEAFRWAIASGRLAECGAVGAEALANALRQPEALVESHLLNRMRFNAAHVRHPQIFAAALETFENKAAPVPVRVLSLEVLLRQHKIDSGFRGSLEQLSTVPVGRFCQVDFVEHSSYFSEAALPTDYQQQIFVATERVAADASQPQVVRDLARCLEQAVRGFESQQSGV